MYFWVLEKWYFISRNRIALLFCVLIHIVFVAPGERLLIFYLSKILCPHQTTCGWYEALFHVQAYVTKTSRAKSLPRDFCHFHGLWEVREFTHLINKYIVTKGQCSLTDHGPPLLAVKTLDRASATASFKKFRLHVRVWHYWQKYLRWIQGPVYIYQRLNDTTVNMPEPTLALDSVLIAWYVSLPARISGLVFLACSDFIPLILQLGVIKGH